MKEETETIIISILINLGIIFIAFIIFYLLRFLLGYLMVISMGG